MKVEVRNESSAPPGLSKNRIYIVLAVSVFHDGRIEFRLSADADGTPSLYPISALSIVDGRIPEGWCATPKLRGGIELSPEEWADQDFWLRFFDGEPDACEVFQRILKTLD